MTSPPLATSKNTVFTDLSVSSIVIPPASTGTTASSRAAVYSSDHVYNDDALNVVLPLRA